VRNLVRAAILVGMVIAMAPAAAGSAVTASVSRSISVWVTPSDSQRPSRVLVTGSLVDFGEALRANSDGRRDPRGSFTLLALHKGSILVGGPELSPSAPTSTAARSGTCAVSTTADDRIPVLRGTRNYAGITGTMTVSVSSVLILPLQPGGKCVTGSGAHPLASWSTITASGTVTISISKT